MRQEVYRVAFDEASAELSEILSKFEQLRLRKDRIEKVVDALKPLVASESLAPSAERIAAPVERQPGEPLSHSPNDPSQAVNAKSDSLSDAAAGKRPVLASHRDLGRAGWLCERRE